MYTHRNKGRWIRASELNKRIENTHGGNRTTLARELAKQHLSHWEKETIEVMLRQITLPDYPRPLEEKTYSALFTELDIPESDYEKYLVPPIEYTAPGKLSFDELEYQIMVWDGRPNTYRADEDTPAEVLNSNTCYSNARAWRDVLHSLEKKEIPASQKGEAISLAAFAALKGGAHQIQEFWKSKAMSELMTISEAGTETAQATAAYHCGKIYSSIAVPNRKGELADSYLTQRSLDFLGRLNDTQVNRPQLLFTVDSEIDRETGDEFGRPSHIVPRMNRYVSALSQKLAALASERRDSAKARDYLGQSLKHLYHPGMQGLRSNPASQRGVHVPLIHGLVKAYECQFGDIVSKRMRVEAMKQLDKGHADLQRGIDSRTIDRYVGLCLKTAYSFAYYMLAPASDKEHYRTIAMENLRTQIELFGVDRCVHIFLDPMYALTRRKDKDLDREFENIVNPRNGV